MDRRQAKTREAIFEAFNRLLEKESYEKISVQDIIDEANVGRTTFYAHFETKNALLNAVCDELFKHVFGHNHEKESTHDFSLSTPDFEEYISHILIHIRDNENLRLLLSNDSNEIFFSYMKNHLENWIADNIVIKNNKVDKDYLLNHISGSFILLLKWWKTSNFKHSPEELSSYYFAVINPVI